MKKLETISKILIIGLLLFFTVGMPAILIYQSNDFDGYEKYKSFCEENDLVIEKRSDLDNPQRCYKINDNKLIKYYTPMEINDGTFVLRENN